MTKNKFPHTYIIHYINDILLANKNKNQTNKTLKHIVQQLADNCLFIAPDKFQHNTLIIKKKIYKMIILCLKK